MVMTTLRQLRYLVALAEHGHFGRAAAACNVTQPALSMQIKELEADLDVPLVERGRHGAILTEEGETLAARARALTAGVKDFEDFARERRGVQARRLVLGIIPSIAPYLLPTILPHLQGALPDLELKVRETQTHTLMTELAGGELDAVIAALPLAQDGIEAHPLFEDPFLLASPAADPLQAKDPRDLPHDRLLLLEEGHCLREQALGACAISDLSTFGATSLTTLLHLVASGQGITLVPKMAADQIADPRIAVSRFPDPQPHRTIGMAWRAASPRTRKLKEIVRRISEGATA